MQTIIHYVNSLTILARSERSSSCSSITSTRSLPDNLDSDSLSSVSSNSCASLPSRFDTSKDSEVLSVASDTLNFTFSELTTNESRSLQGI